MKPLPKNPCNECCYKGSCDAIYANCSKRDTYKKTISEYDSKGILEIAEKISERESLKEEIKKNEEKKREIEKDLPDFVLGNENPFRTNFYQKSLRDSNSISGNEFGTVIWENGRKLVYLEEVQKLIEAGALKVDYDALEEYIFNKRVD